MSHTFLMLLDIVKLKMGYVSGEMEFPQIVPVCLTGFTLAEIYHELISTAILLPSAGSDSWWVVVSYKRKYVHEVLVNHLAKLAQGKSV